MGCDSPLARRLRPVTKYVAKVSTRRRVNDLDAHAAHHFGTPLVRQVSRVEAFDHGAWDGRIE